MPILDHWEIKLSLDDVLRSQGADPDVIRSRRPKLVAATEASIERGLPLLKPRVLYEKYAIKSLTHERLELSNHRSEGGKYYLSGPLIVQHLKRAEAVILVLCTIGRDLDDTLSSVFHTDPLTALALDGVGSAAVENLGLQACNYFEMQVKNDGLNTSLPLSPGMMDWPVEVGQPQIFSLLDCEEIQVSLTDSWMMVPNKSISMVLGVGIDLSASGATCDFCNLNGVCKYQNHYAQTT